MRPIATQLVNSRRRRSSSEEKRQEEAVVAAEMLRLREETEAANATSHRRLLGTIEELQKAVP
jgi:hypothetical protein